jgi:hypothetical protein
MLAGKEHIWVHANATEHLAEGAIAMLNKGASFEAVALRSQAQLKSLQSAVREATIHGVPLNQLVRVAEWELKFSRKASDTLPVLIHALPLR